MTLSRASELTEGDECRSCGGPLTWRQAKPYPVLAQVLFGLSFLVFLIWGQSLFLNGAHRELLVGWIAIQVGLGVWLVRGRLQTRKRVLRCIRCGQALP